MKKYFILIFGAFLFGNIIYASDIQVRIPDTTCAVGDTILIPVYVDSTLTGENVYSYQLQLQFNSGYINPVDIIIAGTMTNSWGTPIYNATQNKITIAAAGTSVLSGTGILCYIKFKTVTSGGTYINFTSSQYNFFNEGEPSMITDNGYISISSLPNPYITVTPNSGLITKGETLQLYVSGGTAPYSWSVTNPSVASISSTGLLTATAHGFTKVVAEDAAGIIDTTNSDIEIRAFELSVHDTTAWQGSNISIPVYVTDLTGLDVISGFFRITFNQNILVPVTYETAGTLLETSSNVVYNNSSQGEISIAFAGTTSLSGSGVLLYLNFDVSASYSGSTWLNFYDVSFNEGLLGNSDNGYFSTINFSNITVSPSYATLIAGETLQFSASGGIAPHIWSTSNSIVATIDESGLLTAHRSGTVQVIATDQVGASGSSGNITVYDTYVTIPDAEAILNSQFDLPVLIGDLPAGEQISGIEGTISFRSPELTAIDIITEGTLSEGWTFAKMSSGNSIIFAGAGTNQFDTAGVMFKVRFQLNPELTTNEYAYVNITDLTLSEGIPLPKITNGSITGRAGFYINIKTNLQGSFINSEMRTSLNPQYVPNYQPYNSNPWYYYGNEHFSYSPINAVDWVLVELRETAGDVSTATTSTRIARKAALLTKNGNITALDGYSNLLFSSSVSDSLFVVIWHRNHLPVISSQALTLSGGIYTYDFTTDSTKAYGGTAAQTELIPGIWGIYSGDANADGTIDNSDYLLWKTDAGKSGYMPTDFNLNGETENVDKNNKWYMNKGKTSQVPE